MNVEKEILIAEYQGGNKKSLINALAELGYEARVTEDPAEVRDSKLVILPGVGAFPEAVKQLKENGLWKALIERHEEGKPIMGICLGMQLFYEASEEDEYTSGFGFMKGNIKRLEKIEESMKIPHMGWNSLRYSGKGYPYLKSFEDTDVYFVHSYRVACGAPETEVLSCDYGQRIPSVVIQPPKRKGSINTAGVAEFHDTLRGKIIGFQFHPEKSGKAGLELLGKILEKEVDF